VREGSQAQFIDHQTTTGQVVSVSGQTGEYVPLYCTAHGKALLADFDLPGLKSLFGGLPLQAYSSSTEVSLARLAKELVKIHADGYAIDDGEYRDELRCVAAPVRDRTGAVVAAVGISAPSTRFPHERYAIVAEHVLRCAKDIGVVLAGEE
jgi:DNA-binding IclR family transcriptional regulator